MKRSLIASKRLGFSFGLCQAGMLARALEDPEAGRVGEAFAQACKLSGSTETLDEERVTNAGFLSFAFPPDEGGKPLRNRIVYGPTAFDNGGRLFAARAHEFLHALQYRKAVVLHTDPFNVNAPFFLCPEDYVRRKELLEADAYAKGAWLQSLASVRHEEMSGALDKTPLSVGKFNELRAEAGSLQKTLEQAAVAAGDNHGQWLGDGSLSAARDLWHALALEEYANIIKARKEEGEKNFVFVRMTDDDAKEIGLSFGPNPFDNGVAPLQLSPANKKTLEKLNEELGITAATALPTIDEALAQKGMTRGGLIAAAYKSPAPPKAPKNSI